MSNNRNNDEAMGAALVIGFIGAVCAVIIAYYLVVGLILTILGTGMCIAAWNKPYDSDNVTIFPNEARAFIARGLIFLVIAMIATIWGVEEHRWKIGEGGWWAIAILSYMAGSLGVQIMMSGEKPDGSPDIFPKRAIPALPSPEPTTIDATAVEIDTPAPEPFHYADWDDAELRS